MPVAAALRRQIAAFAAPPAALPPFRMPLPPSRRFLFSLSIFSISRRCRRRRLLPPL
jgi:hypothetical protein